MPRKTDPDSPELTAKDFAKMRPAAEVLPAGVIAQFKRPGRPKADQTKVPVTLRLDMDVVEKFKASGPGWQTRMNEVLAAAVRPDDTAGTKTQRQASTTGSNSASR